MSTVVNCGNEPEKMVRLDSLKPGDTFFFAETGVYYMKLAYEHVFRLTGNQSYGAFQRTTMSEGTLVVPTDCEINLKKVNAA